MNIPTLEQTIERMKAEILADIAGGRFLGEVITCFADLNDHVDANEYGGFCEDQFADALIAHFGGRDAHEGMPQGMLDYINAAQTAIDDWIVDGAFNYIERHTS